MEISCFTKYSSLCCQCISTQCPKLWNVNGILGKISAEFLSFHISVQISQMYILREQCLDRHLNDSYSPIRITDYPLSNYPLLQKLSTYQGNPQANAVSLRTNQNGQTVWESEAQFWFAIATSPLLIILLSFIMFCWMISVSVIAQFLRPGTSHFSCLQNLKYSYSSEVIKYLVLKNWHAWSIHFCPFPVHWKRYIPQK